MYNRVDIPVLALLFSRSYQDLVYTVEKNLPAGWTERQSVNIPGGYIKSDLEKKREIEKCTKGSMVQIDLEFACSPL